MKYVDFVYHKFYNVDVIHQNLINSSQGLLASATLAILIGFLRKNVPSDSIQVEPVLNRARSLS